MQYLFFHTCNRYKALQFQKFQSLILKISDSGVTTQSSKTTPIVDHICAKSKLLQVQIHALKICRHRIIRIAHVLMMFFCRLEA